MGHVNSHQLNRRTGGAVLPGLVAFFETADLVDHPGSHALSGTSISRSADRWQAKANVDDFGDSRGYLDRRPDVDAVEFVRRFHSPFRGRGATEHTAHTSSTRRS